MPLALFFENLVWLCSGSHFSFCLDQHFYPAKANTNFRLSQHYNYILRMGNLSQDVLSIKCWLNSSWVVDKTFKGGCNKNLWMQLRRSKKSVKKSCTPPPEAMKKKFLPPPSQSGKNAWPPPLTIHTHRHYDLCMYFRILRHGIRP